MTEPPPDPWPEIFAPLGPIAERNHTMAQSGPVLGSQAAVDGTTALGRIAWDLASPAAGIGIEHLFAWKELRLPSSSRSPDPSQPIIGIQTAFAHLTLLRAAIEACATARWLCDPALEAGERTRRAAGVQLSDYEHRAQWERGLGDASAAAGGRTARQRMAGLKRLLRLCDVTPIPAPSATRLFGLYAVPRVEGGAHDAEVEGRSLFRLVSGMAHAKQWAVLPMTEITALIEQPGGRKAVRVEPRDDLAAGVTSVAMRVADDAIGDMERYAGRPM